MTQTEALKLALEAHKKNERHRTLIETRYWCDQYKLLATQAIEALAQPEQEPVAYCWKSLSTGDLFDFVENKNGDALKEQDEDFPTSNLILLYTTPPQRTCQGCGKVAKP